jgi:hypothetical protein
MRRIVFALLFVFATSPALAQACAGRDRATQDALKASSFSIEEPRERGRFALALVECLGDADPAVRDGFAFSGISSLLRADALSAKQKRALMSALLVSLDAPADEAGLRRPFAALALSEIARADRVAPFLNDKERAQLLAKAADYVASVSDYRGFDDKDGWRHGVAHGADWLMQLALNPKIGRDGLERIVAAVAKQAAPSAHSYIFGESERVARPVLFAARRPEFAGYDWNSFASSLTDPAPLKAWDEAFGSKAALARLHNLKAFFSTLYVATATAEEGALSPLKGASLEALKRLP